MLCGVFGLSHILFLTGDAVEYIQTLATDVVFAQVFVSCSSAGEKYPLDQEGTELALDVGAKSLGARGCKRSEGPGA